MSKPQKAQAHASPLALFISDLHLQESHPRTTAAFLAFLAERAIHARALYLLGDLFEYWAGDDDMDEPFIAGIAQALRRVSDAGVALYWIAGNRDFLVGERFAARTGATLLPDPYVAEIGGRRVLLAHGDAQCTDDVAYMDFRRMVREPAWQRQFMATPLARRKAVIAGMREQSREQQRGKSMEIMDVNAGAVDALFAAHGVDTLIHGHTHRPACHALPDGRRRYVLPDWEFDGDTPRGGWIAIGADGAIHRHGPDGALLD
jgi:UDP-2,3-diacylglucosamine hydrolase